MRHGLALRRTLFGLVLVASAISPALGQDVVERELGVLLSRLPANDGADARLLVPSGDGFTVHREGGGMFECVADQPGDERFAVECYHRTLIPIREHGRALVAEGLSGEAFRERMCADIETNLMLQMPMGGYWITASAPRAPDGSLPPTVTVYHFVQLPNLTRQGTGLPPAELSPGAPWLHNPGTCDAHLMWAEEATVGD